MKTQYIHCNPFNRKHDKTVLIQKIKTMQRRLGLPENSEWNLALMSAEELWDLREKLLVKHVI